MFKLLGCHEASALIRHVATQRIDSLLRREVKMLPLRFISNWIASIGFNFTTIIYYIKIIYYHNACKYFPRFFFKYVSEKCVIIEFISGIYLFH